MKLREVRGYFLILTYVTVQDIISKDSNRISENGLPFTAQGQLSQPLLALLLSSIMSANLSFVVVLCLLVPKARKSKQSHQSPALFMRVSMLSFKM